MTVVRTVRGDIAPSELGWTDAHEHATWYATRSDDPAANFAAVTFHPALRFYFKAGGASVEFDAAPGPATFARLGLWDDRLYFLIVPGEIVDLPHEQRRALNEQTNPTWPHVHARLHCEYEEFVQVFPCNHVLATAGDAVRTLVQLAEIAGIPPVVLGPRGRRLPIWDRLLL